MCGPLFARCELDIELFFQSVPLVSLRLCTLLAASLSVTPFVASIASAQTSGGATERHVALHDSMDVRSLIFPGARAVSVDDLKRVIFTRTSSCRLVLIAPLCKLTPSQLFTDRRRTTP